MTEGNVNCDDCATQNCEIRRTGKVFPCVDYTQKKTANEDTDPYPDKECPHRNQKCNPACAAYVKLRKPEVRTTSDGKNFIDTTVELRFNGCGYITEKPWQTTRKTV